jgi:hypothetical protein
MIASKVGMGRTASAVKTDSRLVWRSKIPAARPRARGTSTRRKNVTRTRWGPYPFKSIWTSDGVPDGEETR